MMRLFNKSYTFILLSLIFIPLIYTQNGNANSEQKKASESRNVLNKHTYPIDNVAAHRMKQRRNELHTQLNLPPPIWTTTGPERQRNSLTPEAQLRNEANKERGLPSWVSQVVDDLFYFMQFGNTQDLQQLYQNIDTNVSEKLPQNLSNPLSTADKLKVLRAIVENIGPNAVDIHSGETILHKLLKGHAVFQYFLEARGGALESDVLLRRSMGYLLSLSETDLTIRDANGRMSIHYAAIYKPELILDFIQAGADPMVKDAIGHSSVRYAVTFQKEHSGIIQSLKETYDITVPPESLTPLSIADINDPDLLSRDQARSLIERELTTDEQRRTQFINDLINDSEKYSESWRRSILQHALMENERFRKDLKREYSLRVNGQQKREGAQTQKRICNF